MTATGDLLHHPLTRMLACTLLHLLWQGALVGLSLAAVLTMLRRSTAHARYLACCLALVVLAACPVVTFTLLIRSGSRADVTTPVPSTLMTRAIATSSWPATAPLSTASGWSDLAGMADRLLPLLSICWCIGVIVMSLRLLGGWLGVCRLQFRAARPIEGELRDRCTVIARQMGITHAVELLESTLVEVPSTFGWLRSVILLPASALSGLSPAALEALLAHELAHIRRCDYVVNLLQTTLEALLFYHPATWWISRQIRQEREHCCDDLAVAVLGDARGYARALAALEVCRQGAPAPALGAADGELLLRIRRVLGAPVSGSGTTGLTTSGAAAMVVATLLCGSALTLALPGAYREGAAVVRNTDRTVRRTVAATILGLLGEKRTPAIRTASSRPDRPAHLQSAPQNGVAVALAPGQQKHAAERAGVALKSRDTAHGSSKNIKRARGSIVWHDAPGAGLRSVAADGTARRMPGPAILAAPVAPPILLSEVPEGTVASVVKAVIRTTGAPMGVTIKDAAEHEVVDAKDVEGDANGAADFELSEKAADGAEEAAQAMEARLEQASKGDMEKALKEANRAIDEAMRTAGAEMDRALASVPVQLQAHREVEQAKKKLRQAQQHSRQALELAHRIMTP